MISVYIKMGNKRRFIGFDIDLRIRCTQCTFFFLNFYMWLWISLDWYTLYMYTFLKQWIFSDLDFLEIFWFKLSNYIFFNHLKFLKVIKYPVPSIHFQYCAPWKIFKFDGPSAHFCFKIFHKKLKFTQCTFLKQYIFSDWISVKFLSLVDL